MQRLCDRAFEILSTAVNKCTQDNLAQEIGRKIVMQRLDKLRSQIGEPLSMDELRQVVSDQFPNFDQDILVEAARVNRRPNVMQRFLWGGIGVTGFIGFLWFVNLPYPIIRWPVARTMPVLLLPSYVSMDYHYSQAFGLREEIEQLIQNANTITDINLAEGKVEQAYQHLDQIPAWFLTSEAERYCILFKCRSQLGLEAYETTRQNVERLEAQVIQEQYAHQRFNEAEAALQAAQVEYQKLKSGQQKAIAAWQTAIDLLDQIPTDTLAGRISQKTSTTAQQDFAKQVDEATRNQRGSTLMATAQQYALQASKMAQNPPHPTDRWQQSINLWKKALRQLEKISEGNEYYEQAQKKFEEYQSNLKDLEVRLKEEEESIALMKQAQKFIEEWREIARSENPSMRSLSRKLNQIIYTLDEVHAGTTVYGEAQDLLRRTRYTRSQL